MNNISFVLSVLAENLFSNDTNALYIPIFSLIAYGFICFSDLFLLVIYKKKSYICLFFSLEVKELHSLSSE
jgi:K+-sensing histidine kinase KdpD